MTHGPVATAGERRAVLTAAANAATNEVDRHDGWDGDLEAALYTYLKVSAPDVSWCVVVDDDTGGRWFEWSE